MVLVVFATKVAGVEDDTALDVVVIREDKKQKLKNVFWDMHEITSRIETAANGDNSEKSCVYHNYGENKRGYDFTV